MSKTIKNTKPVKALLDPKKQESLGTLGLTRDDVLKMSNDQDKWEREQYNKRIASSYDMSDDEYQRYLKTHDFRTYIPKTDYEKAQYDAFTRKVNRESRFFKEEVWQADYEKGKAQAKIDFQSNPNLQPVDNPEDVNLYHMLAGIFDFNKNPDLIKYCYSGFKTGYNDALKIDSPMIKEYALNVFKPHWDEEEQRSYDETVQMYGGDAENLYDFGKAIQDKPIDNKNMINYFLTYGDQKYYWDPTIYGHNRALHKLFEIVPPPQKKGWADYFVDGFTAPFKVASQIPGLNAIPGIKQVANLTDTLNGGGLPFIKGNFLV